MLSESYQNLLKRLAAHIPASRLITDPLRTLAYGTDASFYRLIPKVIVKVETETEVRTVLNTCRELKLAVTFRAAGTSLSGQAISESVLVLLGIEGWRDCRISSDGSEIALGAGILGADANTYLAPYGKKLGPDPASINSAKIGGIVSNNACGMASGVDGNSMGTVTGMRIIFADGTILDTRNDNSRKAFLDQRKEMVERIVTLARRLSRDKEAVARIKRKYQIKNTTGYSVNALINFKDPIDIIQHLLIGSEGTLGFISQVTFRTLDTPIHSATGLMLFPDIAKACEAVWILKKCRVSAAELMDRTALRSVQDKRGMPSYIKDLGDEVTALLVETSAGDGATLQKQVDDIKVRFDDFPLAHEFEFSTDPVQADALWDIRKGLFPSACISRPKGTTVIIEDIAVPVGDLKGCLIDLQELFKQYTYKETIIWGHVFDGNVHFVLSLDFADPDQIKRYQAFMEDIVALVVDKYDGSLKAEHGTGRNMAPFVRREWGEQIYDAMWEIKDIFDPQHLINPGVLINDDPHGHIKNLKPMPRAHELVDVCIECGFCERNCMSHGLTLSARQRIVIYREMARLTASGQDPSRLEQLQTDFRYYGEQTCAADGLCATSCPVEIDTGELIKALRQEQLTPTTRRIADHVGQNMGVVTSMARLGLGFLDKTHTLLGTERMTALTSRMRTLSGDRLPFWTPAMPTAAQPVVPRFTTKHRADKVVYFPACINRTMGPARGQKMGPLTGTTEALLKKAGYDIVYPQCMEKLCCGMPFASKGMIATAEKKARELGEALLSASNGGTLPVLCDMSPCLYHMKQILDPRLRLFEPIEFCLEFLTSRLTFTRLPETIVIHTVCSAKKMELETDFQRLAEMCADQVIAADITCCGFAGDRGFSVPELNAHGLRDLKSLLPPEVTAGFATSRTCEIGLSHHSGIDFQSILYLVDRCTNRLFAR